MCVNVPTVLVPTLFLDLDTESGHSWALGINSKYQGLNTGLLGFIEVYENIAAPVAAPVGEIF